MESRIKKIYKELYTGIKTKNELANKLDVNVKTIDNTISKYPEDIILDKNLGAYRFTSLLPSKIPNSSLFELFQDSIENQMIKSDFLYLTKIVLSKEDINLPMIETKNLSNLVQKIISCNLAINSNCSLEINYFSNKGTLETKYIKPHQVFVDKNKYYLYSSYSKKNEKDIGKFRTLAFNGISSIIQDEYIKNESFTIDSKMNAYGLLNKEKYVILTLKNVASNFFKKEGMFSKDNYEFILEEIDGSINVKMYYNDIQEIISLVQNWMPHISISSGEVREKVYEQIKLNYEGFQKNWLFF